MKKFLALVSSNLLSIVYILFGLILVCSAIFFVYFFSPLLAKSSFLDSTQVGFILVIFSNTVTGWMIYREFRAERHRLVKRKNFSIRPILPTDEAFLWKMLYQAFDIPERVNSNSGNRAIEMSRYLKDWGRPDDYGVIAIDQRNQQPIGAAWFRLLTGDEKGYAYVDDRTPELVFAVLPEYQIVEIKLSLLSHVFAAAKDRFSKISARVTPKNFVWFLARLPKFEVASKKLKFEVVTKAKQSMVVAFQLDTASPSSMTH